MAVKFYKFRVQSGFILAWVRGVFEYSERSFALQRLCLIWMRQFVLISERGDFFVEYSGGSFVWLSSLAARSDDLGRARFFSSFADMGCMDKI